MRHSLRATAGPLTVAAALSLVLVASCGTADQQERAPAGPGSADQGPPPVSQQHMVAAIESVVDGIEGADNCDGGRVVGDTLTTGDPPSRWRPTPTVWLGPEQPKADGDRPEFVGRVSFCAPAGDKQNPARYLMHVHGFESEATARSWFDELRRTASEDGLPVDNGTNNPHYVAATGIPPSADKSCEAVGRQRAAEPGSGHAEDLDGAINIVLEYPCVPADTSPFDWEPTTLMTVPSGAWVAAVEVTRTSGTATYQDEKMMIQAQKRIEVLPTEQAEALAGLLDALNSPTPK